MTGRVLVLNASFEPINVCNERRAVVMIFKGVARVEEHNGHMLHSAKLTIHGGGAYYSFARLTHEYGYGSDIELSSGYLSVGFAGADYGLMTTIGQVPLEEVSLEHPLAAFLASYKPPNEEADARLEHRSFRPAGKIIHGRP